MLRTSYRIATIGGIPIRLHISLVFTIGFLIVYDAIAFGISSVPFTLVFAVAFVASIVVHELAHCFVGIRKGARVRQITLMMIGGAAQMEGIPTRPRDEMQMAIAGPAMSLVIGGSLMGLSAAAALLSEGLASVLFLVGFLNIVLAGFNLIPAFPTDGGRVLRAALTRKLGRVRATYVAAKIGKILAVCLGVAAFFNLLPWSSSLGRMIMIFIAVYLYTQAGNEYRIVRMQEAAKGGGFGLWSRVGYGPYADGGDDQVSVGPPPYEKGPDRKTDLRPDDENPFRNLFGG
ncbi:MAG: site-2 protease family protein [Kiritimatiellia bacterium]